MKKTGSLCHRAGVIHPLLAVAALLLLVGGLAVYYVVAWMKTPEPSPEKPALPSASIQPMPLVTTTPASKAMPSLETPPFQAPSQEGGTQPGKKSRAAIDRFQKGENNGTLAALHVLGQNFLVEGLSQDAHLTFHYAAMKGYLPAMIVLAEANDPALLEQTHRFLEEPDPEQAFKWYKQAYSRGFLDATVRLDRLRDWAEQSARSGNRAAKRLLLQWLTQPSGN